MRGGTAAGLFTSAPWKWKYPGATKMQPVRMSEHIDPGSFRPCGQVRLMSLQTLPLRRLLFHKLANIERRWIIREKDGEYGCCTVVIHRWSSQEGQDLRIGSDDNGFSNSLANINKFEMLAHKYERRKRAIVVKFQLKRR
jgi:hypothetical protein